MALWSKPGERSEDAIVRYCAGDDVELDARLWPYDVDASRAHVAALNNIQMLDDAEAARLDDALASLRDTPMIAPDDEDGHSALERVLTERLGDLGKKVHTGRSRNDQVLVAQRLFTRAQLDAVAIHLRGAARALLDRAREHEHTLMPGYTHLQRAVPSTVGFLFAGHAESYLEDLVALEHARALLDGNPLGTAAGFGVNLPLDRDHTTAALGFSRPILNGQAAQNSRGRIDAHIVSALLCALGTTRRLAWDVSIFTSNEFAFFALPPAWCTGSSIMPNKRNPDVVELLRARYVEVAAHHTQLLHASALPSGYQRDLQITKRPLLDALSTAHDALALVKDLVAALIIDKARCAASVDAAMLATDDAVERARNGVPFRDAYAQAAAAIGHLDDDERVKRANQSIQARVSPGAPGNLGLDLLEARLTALTAPA